MSVYTHTWKVIYMTYIYKSTFILLFQSKRSIFEGTIICLSIHGLWGKWYKRNKDEWDVPCHQEVCHITRKILKVT